MSEAQRQEGGLPSASASPGMRITELGEVRGYRLQPVLDPVVWATLFAAVPTPHITQAWPWGEAKRAAVGWRTRRVVFDAGGWSPRRFVISRRGDPVAICQVLDKRLAGVTVAMRVNRGPLFFEDDCDEDVLRDVYFLLKNDAVRARRPLSLAPALPDSPEMCRLLKELGYRPREVAGWVSDRVDLRPDEQRMFARMSPEWRRLIRRAHDAGVEFRVTESSAEIDWIIERHVEHMRTKQFVGMNPPFLRALRDATRPQDLLVAQVLLDGKRLGGSITLRFADVAEGLVFWVGAEGRRVNAGRYLNWQAALELRRRGCRWFDLGGKRKGATETFKAGMGGIEYRLLNEWVAF